MHATQRDGHRHNGPATAPAVDLSPNLFGIQNEGVPAPYASAGIPNADVPPPRFSANPCMPGSMNFGIASSGQPHMSPVCGNGHAFHHRQSQQNGYSFHNSTPVASLWKSNRNDDYRLSKHGVSDLPMFEGDHGKYKVWKDKLMDHAAEGNAYRRALLKHAQDAPQSLDCHCLASTRYGNANG